MYINEQISKQKNICALLIVEVVSLMSIMLLCMAAV